jgi:putative membrane protein
MSVSDLPALNAALNGVATVLLTLGFLFIRAGRREAHRACMVGALAVSVVFLATYVLHKILVGGVHTPFGGEGWVRPVYFVMLVTHIVLAMAIVPLVLVTFTHAWKERFDRHRRWARWTFPLWYYVSVTGVLIYFFLYRWFPSAAAAANGAG